VDTTTSQLEVRLRNRSVILPNEYPCSLAVLRELIAPPLAKVAKARILMARGMDIEKAAVAAGLPAAEIH
jgi:hypothetical protein